MEFLCPQTKDLKTPALWMAKRLKFGDLILLDGPMGAGKTSFVRALALALGCMEEVSSPTFALLNEYLLEKGFLWHADLYRIQDLDELFEAGFFEYLNRIDGLLCVEWPQRCPGLLGQNCTYQIDFSVLPNQQRRIFVQEVSFHESSRS